MDINPTNINQLNRTAVTVWNRGRGRYTPHIGRIAAKSGAAGGKAVFGWLGATPGLKPFGKELEYANLASVKWEVTPDPFGIGWSIPRRDIKNDQFGQYATMFAQNGLNAAIHPDMLAMDMLVNGFTRKDYTGKNFFDTAKEHAPGVGKNKFTNKSTKVLNPTYFGQAIAGLGKILAPDGTPFSPFMDLTLIVGEDNRSAAEDIVMVDTLSTGGKNKYYQRAKLIVTPLITGSQWFLLNNGLEMQPLVYVDEEPVTFTARTDPQSDNVFKKEAFEYKSYGIHRVDFGVPQLAWGSTGADA
jgi:phage major head subunit gpT-like protein